MFPDKITIAADGNELELVSISKDGQSATYIYTKSTTKKDQQVTLTEKQIINNIYRP